MPRHIAGAKEWAASRRASPRPCVTVGGPTRRVESVALVYDDPVGVSLQAWMRPPRHQRVDDRLPLIGAGGSAGASGVSPLQGLLLPGLARNPFHRPA